MRWRGPYMGALRWLTLLLLSSLHRFGTDAAGPYGVIPDGYNRQEAPLHARVLLSVVVTKLHGVDAATNVVRLTAKQRRYWYDPRLGFSMASLAGSSGAGLESLTVDPGKIWVPDVEVKEKVDEFVESCNEHDAVLFSDEFVDSLPETGRYNVYFTEACILAIKCRISLRDFPFDVNRCNITFTPWVDKSYQLVRAPGLSHADLITQQYEVAFDKQAYDATRTIYLPGDKALHFNTVVYSFSLARFDRYYMACLVVPLLMMVFLAWLTFFTPLNKSDRLAYCVTLVLAAMAVQYITADKRPPEVEDGWIDRFQTCIYIFIILPILETAVLFRLESVHERMGEIRKGEVRVHMVERVLRFFYPVMLTIFIIVFLGPGSPYWRKRHSMENGLGISNVLFGIFWLPVVVTMTACALWNWCKLGPSSIHECRDAIQTTLLDHEVDPEVVLGPLNVSVDDAESDGSSLSPSSRREMSSLSPGAKLGRFGKRLGFL